MDLRDALRSTAAVRSFTPAAVDDATVHAILDDARFAPSGGNRQPWRVAVVRDRRLREQLAELMRPVWDDYVAAGATGDTPFAFGRGPHTGGAPSPRAPNPLLDALADAPAVLVVAADLHRVALMDGELDRPPITGGGSIHPFCWSILLAARERGLGGVMTTFLSRAEPAAAPLLGLPEGHALAATIVLGHPVHQPTRLRRQPVSSFATVDRFDGDPLPEPGGVPT